MSDFYGLDEFMVWLYSNGFRFEDVRPVDRANHCNWYAFRAIQLPVRACETNKNKKLLLCVEPKWYSHHGLPDDFVSVEVEVRGQASGVWFQLKAYSLSVDEVMRRLDDVEIMLVSAWNTLFRPGG